MGVYVTHLDAQRPRILYVNQRAADIIGRAREDIVGRLPWDFFREDGRTTLRAVVERPAGAPPLSLSLVIERPDGRYTPIEMGSTRIRTVIGELSFGYFRDVTSEREALEALRRSEARFRFLVEAAPDGVVILKRGVIVFINPKAARLLGVGVDEALGRTIASFLPPADAARAGERMATMLRDGVEFPPSEYAVRAEIRRTVEIKSVVCEWEGVPCVLAFARDVTESKALRDRMVESDRLAAVGTLAAGVAHEINNPLTYVQLSAHRLTRLVDRLGVPRETLAELRSHLAGIHHGLGRVASITQLLRAFVTDDSDAPGPVDLDVVIAHALKMVDNDLRHAARLACDLAPTPPVTGSAPRLEQVLVNVLINAIKALPPGSAAKHEIYVGKAHAGDRVTVTIRDTGCGIPASLRSRIFEPFFTTRDVGHGMGLGLSVSKTIVEKLGGDIEVDSIENVGTTVRIHLPIRPPGIAAVELAVAVESAPVASPAARRRRVLVVDDEAMICRAIEEELARCHDVAVATTGADALALVASTSFDLILCDVMMPGMDGHELHRRIAAQYPGLERRFVFMTGTLAPDAAKALDELPNPWLAKPFEIDDVLALIAASPEPA